MGMKGIFITALLTFGLEPASAQNDSIGAGNATAATSISAPRAETIDAGKPVRSVYLELLGPSNMVGVSYDARFKGHKGWGWRAGFGYLYFPDWVQYASLPLEINYLAGNRNHKFEVGLGFDPLLMMAAGEGVSPFDEMHLGYYFHANVGYRYQRPKGFQFRIGLSPSLTFYQGLFVKPYELWPYVSFGWSF